MSGADDVQAWLDAYASQEPRRAQLWLPPLLAEALNALPDWERQAMLHMVDGIAVSHGLATPTEIHRAE